MKKLISLFVFLFLALILVALPLLAACAQPAPAPAPTPAPTPAPPPREEIVLKFIGPWPKEFKQTDGYYQWIDYVNKIGKGKVQIKVVGGPETIDKMQQFEATRTGVVDISTGVGGYSMGAMPEGQFMSLSPFPTPKYPNCAKLERQVGLTALMEDVLHDQGLEYLGRTLLFSPIFLFSKEPVNKPGDLSGRKMRSLARYNHLIQAYGAVPVGVEEPEMYTALERGVIAGFIHALLAVGDLGWIDFTKYGTPEPFFEQDVWIQVNLNKWKSLPKDVQDLLDQSILYAEEEIATKYYKGLVDSATAKLEAKGLKFIPLSKDDSKLWQETLHSGTMKMLSEKAKPQYFARFQEILKAAEKMK